MLSQYLPLRDHQNLPCLHRDHEEVAENLKTQYNLSTIYSAKLGGWEDHEAVHKAVATCPADLILASGGPSGKSLVVDLAKKYGKVVLDVGNGMTKSWCKNLTESIECK